MYLVRHTKVDVTDGICYGQSNVGVANTFETESYNVLSQLKDKNFEVFFSSPLTRCSLLAEKIAGDKVLYDNRLMELNFGNWEMLSWDNIYQQPLGSEWMNDFVHVACPNGESMVQMHQRVVSFLEEHKSQLNENTLIVTHAGVIRSIIAHYKHIPLPEVFTKISVQYGEVICI